MELAPGLRRIGNDLIAVHLVEDERGLTLIDSGLSGQWRNLIAELKAMGRSVDDIRALKASTWSPRSLARCGVCGGRRLSSIGYSRHFCPLSSRRGRANITHQ